MPALQYDIDYGQLAASLLAKVAGGGDQARFKDVPSSTPTTTYGHGSGGLFSSPALEKPLFSAMILPRMGLASRLKAYPSNSEKPLYGIITGVTATTGTDPAGPCDDPKVAGLLKLCTQTSYFARQSRMSRVFELDRIGMVESRGEHFDFQLVGNPLSDVPWAPSIVGGNGGGNAMLNNEFAKAAFELGVSWARDFAVDVYTGNPSNNNAGGGVEYFRGLDLLINTGHRDAITGVACAAADSIVRSANNYNVSTGNNSVALVRTLSDIYRQLQFNAVNMGLAPLKLVIAMRQSLFYELTEIWPCAYHTYRCQQTGIFSASQVQTVDSAALIGMRDQMRGDLDSQTGQFLWIDGNKVEVVIDNTIAESNVGSGTFSSAIYFVPLAVLGSTPVTFWEYVPYAGERLEFARAMAPDGFYVVTDGGRFLWHRKPPNNFCLQYVVKSEPRLIMRTPYLAARYTTLRYTPVSHERDWATDGTYFVDGGQTSYAGYGPGYYTPTS